MTLEEKNIYLYGENVEVPTFYNGILRERIQLLKENKNRIGNLHFSKQNDTQLRKINEAIEYFKFELSR